MKHLLLIVLGLSGIAANAQKINAQLKRQLDSVMVLDQKYREVMSLLMTPGKADSTAKAAGMPVAAALNHYSKLQSDIDSTNIVFVEKLMKAYGYPGASLVGNASSEAAWYIIQHSKVIDQYIPEIKKAAEAQELGFVFYATMLDRYLMYHKKEQVYGTQMAISTLKATRKTEWIVWPIKNFENVNELRKKAGFADTVEENAKRLNVKYRVVRLSGIVM